MTVLSGASRTQTSSSTTLQKALLACGAAYAVVYVVANDVIAASLYGGYNRVDQAVSELSSTGAPSQAFLTWMSPLFLVLMVSFGVGVWRTPDAPRSLRRLGRLIVAFGVSGIVWLAFPMSERDAIAAGTNTASNDVGHLVLAAVSVVMIVACLVLGAVAIQGWFRWYCLVSMVVIMVAGAWGGQLATKLEQGGSTPWLGAVERVSVYGFYLWLAVLSAVLLRALRTSGQRT